MGAFKDKKSGSWYVQFRYTDWQGKRQQKLKRGFATKHEALEWEREFLLQKQTDVTMSFGSFYELYKKDIKPRLKENTWQTKENIIEGKIIPYFKDRKLCDISATDVIEWQNEIRTLKNKHGKLYSKTYLRTVHNQLSAMFNHAVRYYGLRSNPASIAGNMGEKESKEMKFWTLEEYKSLSDFNSLELNCFDENYLHTVSMTELYDTVYENRPPIVDSLLYNGLYLFVGSPKIGKSFLMAQLAYHISTGTPIWNYKVNKGTVLYLALEDDYSRLQKRLYQMFGTDSADNLYLSVSASQLNEGLDKQLESFITKHADTKLIIIDTLQKVREVSSDYSYSNDYEIISSLKKFADNNKICMILVHHTRKQKSDDSFDMISGTNGLLGAADGAFVLQKEKRTANAATLEISGRDQQDQKLYLNRNPDNLIWELERTEEEYGNAGVGA
ncbi:AAA family ATPase [Ruminococcus sp. JE7B6]|uniref:AAA family ATPase n=1 Tax=Ruminococcus sp. JE7B6 TaxID=3233380 RepID=UPI00389B0AAE